MSVHVVWFGIGIAVGAALAWFVASRLAAARQRAAVAEADGRAHLASERLADEKARYEALRDSFKDSFATLSADALKQNNDVFLKAANAQLQTLTKGFEGDLGKREEAIKGLVKPIAESLARYEAQVKELETKREQAYGKLGEQLGTLQTAHQTLAKETTTLATALRHPTARGRWGEITLKRVVELAGLNEHTDFDTQTSVQTDDGTQRPDLVVRVPGGGNVVVDAKAPLDAYLDAMETTDPDARAALLATHADKLRGHVIALKQKAYWNSFDPTPEFVVLFVPGEAFLAAALESRQGLLEEAAAGNVIIASPTTLIGLMKTVALGWRQEKMAANAEEVRRLGSELHERLGVFASHLGTVGQRLGSTVEAYNKAVGSFDARVAVSARRLEELGAASEKDAPALKAVSVAPAAVAARSLEDAEAAED